MTPSISLVVDHQPHKPDAPRVSSLRQDVDPRPPHSPSDWQIEVFYDGDCPLCSREIDLLRRLDRRQKIRFTDIAVSDFRASDCGMSWDELMSEIHGRLPDGTWVRGVEVFRKLYAAIGWTTVVWISRLPIIAGLLDRAYRLFAHNRLRWTRRCVPGSAACNADTVRRTPNAQCEIVGGVLERECDALFRAAKDHVS